MRHHISILHTLENQDIGRVSWIPVDPDLMRNITQ